MARGASRWNLLLSEPRLLIASNVRPPAVTENGMPHEAAPEEVEKKAAPLIGRTVITVKPEWIPPGGPPAGGVGLTLEFGDGSRFVVIPDDQADDGTPLADWELFTPYDMYLVCGPGPVWSYLRSDVAVSNK